MKLVCPDPKHYGCTMGDTFCCYCGQPLIPAVQSKCGSCGATVYSMDKFCGKCGKAVVR